MKKILLLLVLVGNVAFAQKLTKDQLSEKLAEKACGCAEKQEITKDNFELTIGICLLEGINAYEKDVEKHYGKDVISNDKKMEELGYEIGKKMGMKCPTVFKFMLEDEADEVVEVDAEDLVLSGKISEIKSEQFLTFVVKEESGDYKLLPNVTKQEEEEGELQTVWVDGVFVKETTFDEIKARLPL